MSHNAIKVSGASPDVGSNIDLTASNLINNTAQEGKILKYNSGNWTSSGVDLVPLQGYGYHYQDSGGGGGSYTYDAGERYIWRGNNNLNDFATGFSKVNSSSSYTPISNSNWWMGFNMPAGKWLVTWQFNVYMSSSTAYSTWRFATSSSSTSSSYTYHSALSYVKGTQSKFGGLIRCVVDISSASFGSLVNQSKSGSIRISPGGYAHYVNAITIQAL